jgi:hypothetical protein
MNEMRTTANIILREQSIQNCSGSISGTWAYFKLDETIIILFKIRTFASTESANPLTTITLAEGLTNNAGA